MSWNRTVTCSYCYCTGHNSRKCPTKVKRVKERYESHLERFQSLEEGPTKDYWAAETQKMREEYIKYTKIDLATGKKVTNKAAKALRMKKVRCSYCAMRGHTRRTCKNLKNDYAIFKARTDIARQRWYEKLVESGVGIGSLLMTTEYGYNDNGEWVCATVAHVLTAYSVKDVHAHQNRFGAHSLKAVRTAVIGRDTTGWLTRNSVMTETYLSSDNFVKTRSPYAGSAIYVSPAGVVPPLENIPGTDTYPAVTLVFPTGELRSWEYNQKTFDVLNELPANAYAT